MKLKTFVKHCIMQYPTIFSNALDVYNHLFYVAGNGYEWKDGTLQQVGFKTKTKKECVEGCIREKMNRCKTCQEHLHPYGRITKQDVENMIINGYKIIFKQLIADIERIENAETLSEDFVPYDGFYFYPLSQYSKCNQIPEDIRPDWLEGINMFNNFRKQHPELEIEPVEIDPKTGWAK